MNDLESLKSNISELTITKPFEASTDTKQQSTKTNKKVLINLSNKVHPSNELNSPDRLTPHDETFFNNKYNSTFNLTNIGNFDYDKYVDDYDD